VAEIAAWTVRCGVHPCSSRSWRRACWHGGAELVRGVAGGGDAGRRRGGSSGALLGGVDREQSWGRMRGGAVDPCWSQPTGEARVGFSGRGQPCPHAKLDFSFSIGQG
jgi:hypothetical protein